MILEFLSGWVLQIVIFIILAMVVDLILPSSKIKQYAKLVIGLLLILIILQPILSIFKVDVEQLISPVFQTSTNSNLEAEIENQTNQKKNEIESINRAYVLQEMVVQMKNLVEEELNQDYQSAIDHLEVEWKEEETAETTEDITAIYVQLKPFQEGNLETVEKVEINIGESEKELDNESFDNQEIIDFLAEQWQVEADIIHARWKEE
ncbi:stage III sporulation protein AF [Gracilibacillus dipsosauri]|uniref:Stage III sporulation protein AF n=1 Tax=Gracilibacillus dipsosauri TaxID=178340 RepID=A0A317L0H1_9BACI|nr:stage III sporulation protein AF [Gracilibacillus dipsosauri]